MATPFLSSEEYDERAHELYNEGQYDAALDVLREGLNLYPESVELHIGAGFARLAARRIRVGAKELRSRARARRAARGRRSRDSARRCSSSACATRR